MSSMDPKGGNVPHEPSMKGPRSLTIVIKLGTSSIVGEKTHEPLIANLAGIVEQTTRLRKDGHKVVIVSSGAIGVGLRRMDVDVRPKRLPRLQALAAIGQCRLMGLWDSLFTHLRQPIAQILLTRNDIADRTRYLNARKTVMELLDMGVIPIVNENDTLAVSEIKFGDNDTLSAITAAMVHADMLFLMTDVDCLYDKNPRTNPDAQPIEVVEDIAALQADVSTRGSALGTGGMSTKIVAARLATSAGVTTVITRSTVPGNIVKIVDYLQAKRSSSPVTVAAPSPSSCASGTATPPAAAAAGDNAEDVLLSASTSSLTLTDNLNVKSKDSGERPPLHTRFVPSPAPIRDRSFWILHGLRPHGTVYIDAGAHRALMDKAGLLPVGVVDVEGTFAQQEAVRLVVVERRVTHPPAAGPDAEAKAAGTATPRAFWEGRTQEIGRALVNYSSAEIARIKGRQSTEIERLLGYADSDYVAQREYVSLYLHGSRPVTPIWEKEGDWGRETVPEAGSVVHGITEYESNA